MFARLAWLGWIGIVLQVTYAINQLQAYYPLSQEIDVKIVTEDSGMLSKLDNNSSTNINQFEENQLQNTSLEVPNDGKIVAEDSCDACNEFRTFCGTVNSQRKTTRDDDLFNFRNDCRSLGNVVWASASDDKVGRISALLEKCFDEEKWIF
ncbi:hypothetical protein Nepgr_009007 [Nepenthes gracilis]|uniref:Uncharacterized protein n=1 Tax=Nepenthes gracilis TaxID=150966 RepID=A0AAD3XJS2_NEPGR|nr:hypothetical protein Nepgr_009007 [Nepenthes gracilis]